MIGKTEKYIKRQISNEGTITFALLDSENITMKQAISTSKKAEDCGVSAILIGGSTVMDQLDLDKMVSIIKKNIQIPVILFPGNITGISPNADAILFGSLLNSDNPYFITGAQSLGALAIYKYKLETIPMGYIIIGEGGAAGFVGRARGIPLNKPNLAVMYSLAAQYMGMRFLYLEAGSGVTSQISTNIISAVKKIYKGTLIIGGGIKDVMNSVNIAKAGADIIVFGSLLETQEFQKKLKIIIENIKKVKDI